MSAPKLAQKSLAIGTLPIVCAVLVALNSLYLLIVAFGNITDFATNQAFVHHVLAMDTTNFATKAGVGLDPHTIWRAITALWLQNVLYVVLIAWEVVTGAILAIATVLWFRGRSTGYRTARRLSTIGLLMLVLLFFGGFTDIGGEWFQMWTSTLWNGEDPAFRNTVLAVFALVLIHLPNERWSATTDQPIEEPQLSSDRPRSALPADFSGSEPDGSAHETRQDRR